MIVEVRRIEVDGGVYTPLFWGSQMVDMNDLEKLANTEMKQPVRRLRCVIATEERPRSEQPGFSLRRGEFDIPDNLPLVLGDTRFIVGRIQGQAHLEAGRLIATIRLLSTELAEIVWRGIQAGILTGLCSVIERTVDDPMSGRLIGGRFVAVELGARETSCLAGARILDFWESGE